MGIFIADAAERRTRVLYHTWTRIARLFFNFSKVVENFLTSRWFLDKTEKVCRQAPAHFLGKQEKTGAICARRLVVASSISLASAYGEGSLISLLLLSPHEPLRWVRVGAP